MMDRAWKMFIPMLLVMTPTIDAAPPPEMLTKSLMNVIRKHCPEAVITVTDRAFIAKSGTMKFTVHGRSKTGEISVRTHEEEGPNFKGFLLFISQESGPYQGAAAVPQTLKGPYFPTDLDAVPTDDGTGYYWVNFSYGSRLDPELKQALLEAIPRTRIPPTAPAREPGTLPPSDDDCL